MDSDWATGAYTFNLRGSTPAVASVLYTADKYPGVVPHFANGSFSAAQGLNPSAPFTFELSPFIGTNDFTRIGISIVDASGSNAFIGFFNLPTSSTSWTLPAGVLEPERPYRFELIYFSQSSFQATAGTNSGASQSFNLRTTALIQTGPIPEPGTWALMLFGLAAVAARARRRH